MRCYSVFGGCLCSDLPFPELSELAPSRPTWQLLTERKLPAPSPGEYLGQDQVVGPVAVRLYRSAGGYSLRFDDTGTFEVSADGSSISWFAGMREPDDAVRIDVLGRVLALAMHGGGTFCLHGSAVALGGRAVAFLAPKFHGKSTLALALARAGGQLVTDDTLAVDPGPSPSIRPGIQSVRLWGDSAQRLAGHCAAEQPAGAKGAFDVLGDSRLLRHRAPLDAIYLLSPVASPAAAPARRQRLQAVPAALALIRHAKLGPLLGRREVERVLGWGATLARDTPVYLLKVVRDFDRLQDVVDQIMTWHPGAGAPAPAAALA
ncbi:MAG: hypothetical protein H0T44_14770 [Gemmatimonadales bacterium]|nr:hypothetical protein [Gemmatimonadales bacterium]